MAIKVPVIVSYDNKGTKQAIRGIGSLEKSFKKMDEHLKEEVLNAIPGWEEA